MNGLYIFSDDPSLTPIAWVVNTDYYGPFLAPGKYQPDGSLSALNGSTAALAGNWSLRAVDAQQNDLTGLVRTFEVVASGGRVNVALRKRAYASSLVATKASSSEFGPARVTDGDTTSTQTLFQSSCADPGDVTPWLSVDLGSSLAVDLVLIYNTASAGRGYTLMNAELRVGGTRIAQPEDTPLIEANPLVWRQEGRGADGHILRAPLQPAARGQWVTLQNFQTPAVVNADGCSWSLSIAELEVYTSRSSASIAAGAPAPPPPGLAAAPSPATLPPLLPPQPWTHRCRIVLTPTASSVDCAAAGDGQPSAEPPLQISVGTALRQRLGAEQQYPLRSETSDDDSGLTLSGSSHLLIENSLIEGLPLSTVNALLHIANTSFLTLGNVTIRDLEGQPAGLDSVRGRPISPPSLVFGAVRVFGCSGVTITASLCSNVSNAHGWACVWIQAAPNTSDTLQQPAPPPWVRVSNSTIANNAVVWGGPDVQLQSSWANMLTAFDDAAGDDRSSSYGLGALVVEAPDGAAVAISFERATLSNNTGGSGGALAVLSGLPYVTWTAVTAVSNAAAIAGGACFFRQGTAAWTLQDGSSLSGNKAPFGGAACSLAGPLANVLVTGGSRLVGNNATYDGGALYAYAGGVVNMTLDSRTMLSDNSAAGFGGAVCSYRGGVRSLVVKEGSAVVRNTAGLYGGALYSQSGGISGALLDGGSSVSDNSAQRGGALYSASGHIRGLSLANASEMARSRAAEHGGAACAWFGSIQQASVSGGSSLSANAAGADGGALHAQFGGITGLTVSAGGRVSLNTARGSGGAIFAGLGGIREVSFSGSTASSNKADWNGGVFHASGAAGLTNLSFTAGSTLTNNSAAYGGVMCADRGSISNLLISGSEFSQNSAVQDGGAVYVSSGSLVNIALTASRVVRNAARNGGAFAVQSGGVRGLTLLGSEVSDNSAQASGGAVYLSSSEAVDLTAGSSSKLARNAALNGGGGLLASDSTDLQLVLSGGSSITSNAAATFGGALWITADRGMVSLTLLNGSSLTNNTAKTYGGAASVTASSVSITARANGSISGNAATFGGGFLHSSRGNAQLVVSGGSRVAANKAPKGEGGAVLAEQGSVHVQLEGQGTAIAGNTAALDGGALAAPLGLVNITAVGGSVVSRNEASGSGGAISSQEISLRLYGNSTLSQNRAGRNGGALSAASIQLLLIEGNSSVTANTALLSGGAVYATQAVQQLSISSGSLSGNSALLEDGGAIWSPLVAAMQLGADSTFADNMAGRCGDCNQIDGPAR
ncbi:hypothetical protein HYH03_017034 [Edaphochlamys debaryana]|uniref:Uncharacterized protein n=1 Tax=Edaphochlamys debaryana TaxID=47281 RepID=A0A836BR07_9CHLO|nr:hypothetical protein HYH03_017034 [Edaphochlamys debaryana]|eukprot:KAG2484153.1 hypothetical protein HYH03_017034 [Edaphochlamys debaryana]